MWSPDAHSSILNGPVPMGFRLYAHFVMFAGSPVAWRGMIHRNRLRNGA